MLSALVTCQEAIIKKSAHPGVLEDPVKPCFAGNPYGFVSPGRRYTQ